MNKEDIAAALQWLALENTAVCLHSSLKSFGYLEGGAKTILDAFAETGTTVLTPAFTKEYAVPPVIRIPRNGLDYERYSPAGGTKIFTAETNDINSGLGAVPRALLAEPGRRRGYHPLNSFAALGPMAERLVSGQTARNVYAPIEALCREDGHILLMGVDLTSMTAVHYAEELAGRTPFILWANGLDGLPLEVSVGSCSRGFNRLEEAVRGIEKRLYVGNSLWRLFRARAVVDACAEAIKADSEITMCSDPACVRCRDAAEGGPLYEGYGKEQRL